MGLGNNNYKNGSKRSNFRYQLTFLRLLQRILDNLTP
jgi:hypothetical protein